MVAYGEAISRFAIDYDPLIAISRQLQFDDCLATKYFYTITTPSMSINALCGMYYPIRIYISTLDTVCLSTKL